MRTCETARYDAAQDELATAVQALNEKLDAANRQRFKDSQTSWLSYRTANAAFISQLAGGGTLTPLLKETVLADMTAARAKELRQNLKP